MTVQNTPAETVADVMDPARAVALAASLGLAHDPGAPLPPFFHQIYFWSPQPPDLLGRDGHPRRGGVIPDLGLPRRMWAGGDLRFHAPLMTGTDARRTTHLESTAQKTGRSGPLAFVRLRHEIAQAGRICVTEWQDLVYRADPDPADTPPPPPQARSDETDLRRRSFDSTLLFRYSGLTFNGHRIHYDLDYARSVEGYAGLVVHGPLLAQMLMLMAAETGPVESFAFRATSPLMHFETADFCRAGADMWVRGPDGRQCMTARVA
ncbi:MAG: MaoC family dehydratase N-terminal domain-containing protein [Rhodobacteraceae bacterium]|nr:MaoC family dehydratase N-terminal domain-containing protein [Paracoccaceae bacterium]